MPEITRRQLLAFLGATAAVQAAPALLRRTLPGTGASLAEAAWTGAFTPVRVPHPLPIYQSRSSFLAGLGVGQILLPSADPSLATYTVIDDIVVSPELQAYVIVRWGDRVFPDLDDYVGYNHDYTAFFPIHGKSAVQALLWVNHEYVSFPFLRSSPGAPANLSGSPTTFAAVLGFGIPDDPTNLLTLGEMLYNCGGSILRLRRNNRGRYEVEAGDPMNRRIHGLSGLAINAERTDGYQAITAWGALPHQQGDRDYLVGTGPAATEVFPLSSDGLGNRIIGTAFNCSGASTPWDTVLSAEENFQGSSLFFVGVSEDVLPDGTQLGYLPGTTGQRFGQVGEKYGWLVEIDPFGAEPPKKHTALGRFRHENAAIRAERGRPLVVYMGDDRRGGHTWKFVSRDTVGKPSDKHNSRLLEDGTLFVARYGPDGTGVWIPFELSTPTGPIPPTVLSSVEFAALGSARRDGLLKLPRRPGVAGQTASGGAFNLTRLNEATALPAYQGKTLGAFYPTKGAALVDAFLAANLIGGTPCARPEDFEINPRDPRQVIMSMTDGAPGSDGYPDSRIFVVAKYSASASAVQQSGSLHKIVEDSSDGSGTTFRWERLVQAGEAGAQGAGFANIDNLVFDDRGDLWAVNDMTTELHNGLGNGLVPTPTTISHTRPATPRT